MEISLHPALQRAQLLVEHQRYAEAERELRHLLAQMPEHVLAQLLLAETLIRQEKLEEAEKAVHAALALEPASSIAHYTHARVLYSLDRTPEAITAVQEAIAIDPADADYHGLLAAILMDVPKHQEALEAAEKGLSFDPEHVLCLNVRSRMLFKLGRRQEAVQTIDKALEQDPSNAHTHANYGWAWLEKNDPKQALEHFRAALQLDPNLEFAREGMKEAMKARYWVYRQYLRYVFWMSNQSKKQRWVIIIGLYITFVFMRRVADSNEDLSPVLMPLVFAYLAFAFSSWLMQPLGNLFLMLNPYGRYILDDSERKSARLVGVSLGVGVLSFIGLIFIDLHALFLLGLVGLSMMIPLGSMFKPSRPKDRRFLVLYTLGLLAVGLGMVVLSLLGSPMANSLFTMYLVGFIAYQFVANAKVGR